MKGDPFYGHRPSPPVQAAMGDTRRRFRELRDHLRTLPQTRELSLAVTHLQTASLFAIAAQALTDPDAEILDP